MIMKGKTARVAWALALAFAVLTASVFLGANAKLLALDMGSDTTKTALVKPGRSPVTLVTNEMSKRKTPSKVAFNKGARLFGEAAAAIEQRYPQDVFSRIRDALGQTTSEIENKVYADTFRPYKVSEEKGKVLFEVEGGEKYSSEELTVRREGKDSKRRRPSTDPHHHPPDSAFFAIGNAPGVLCRARQ